jgi:hypothetical protein
MNKHYVYVEEQISATISERKHSVIISRIGGITSTHPYDEKLHQFLLKLKDRAEQEED